MTNTYSCPCCHRISDHEHLPPHPADMFLVWTCLGCNQPHDRRQPMSDLDMQQFMANRIIYDNEEAQW